MANFQDVSGHFTTRMVIFFQIEEDFGEKGELVGNSWCVLPNPLASIILISFSAQEATLL